MDLREAAAQISQIREQMARGEVFRGYRSATVGLSGLLAIAAAVVQQVCIASPMDQLAAYLTLWIGVAAVSAVLAASEIVVRARAARCDLVRRQSRVAVEQLAPCLVAGVIGTAVVATTAADAAWILPGVWSLLFGLGVFSSYRLLPRAAFWVGAHYLFAGGLCLWLGQGAEALSPWSMGISFGIGQLLTAGILYWTLERESDSAASEN
jgi:hypothetical protein